MERYVVALDQGTTSSRAILFNRSGGILSRAQYPFRQIYPRPGWVEHDPMDLWNMEKQALAEVVDAAHIDPKQVVAIGITNQPETTILWDRVTGVPVYNAIVWQCRRTAAICDRLKADGLEELVAEKTGLLIDAYFSGTKIKWILDNVPGARERAEKGELHVLDECDGMCSLEEVHQLAGNSRIFCGAVERLEGDAEQAERSAHVLDAAQREGLGEGDCPQRKGNFDIVDENVQQRVSNPGNIQDHQRLDAAVFKLVADSDSVGRIPDNTGSFDDLNALCFHRLLCCCKQLAGSLAAAFVMTCNTDKSCNNLFHGKVSLLCFLF